MSKIEYRVENNIVFYTEGDNEKTYICYLDDIETVIFRLRKTIQRVNDLLLTISVEDRKNKIIGDMLVLMTKELNELNKIWLLHN